MTKCLKCSYIGYEVYKQCEECWKIDNVKDNELTLLLEMLQTFADWVQLIRPHMSEIQFSEEEKLREMELVNKMVENNRKATNLRFNLGVKE
jgi:hypothetical protein